MGFLYFSLLFLGCFDVSSGIIAQLGPYAKESISLCKTGFLHGLDRYLYNGSLNTTSQDLSRRQVVFFEMQSSLLNGYTTICTVNLYPNCDSNQALGCFCKNSSGSSLELFLNLTADIQYSNGTIQIRWPKLGVSDVSNEERVPVIYGEPIENLTNNKKAVYVEQCSLRLETTNFVKWCVTGLSSHNLTSNISSASSETECLSFTFTPSETEITNAPIYFSLQYVELQDCNRTKTRECYFYTVSTTTISTLNTTAVPTTSPTTSNQTFSSELVGVLSAHVVCTVTLIGVSIFVLVIILVNVKKQQNTNKRLLYIDLLCILISLFEIVEIILVIIAGIKLNGEGKTTLDIWKVMVIYQFLVNIVFIIVESCTLGIKKNSNGFHVGSQGFLYILTLICIHTVIAIIAVPFIWLFLQKASPQPKEISPTIVEKPDSHTIHNRPQ